MVRVIKKTLDYYLGLLRNGNEMKFDFEKAKDKKIRVLRRFVEGHEYI